MASIPVIILLLGSIATWTVGRRSPRVSWGVATAATLLAWGASLGLYAAVPSEISLSFWTPASVIATRLTLSLDQIGWQLMYAASTLLLAVSLTSITRPQDSSAGMRAIGLAYGGLAMLALLAGNLLTVIMSWAVMDLAAFVLLLSRVDDVRAAQQLVGRLAVDAGGVLLVVAAALATLAEGGTRSLGGETLSPLAAVLLAGAVLLRLGLLPLHFSLSPLFQVRRGMRTLLRLMPPAVGLAAAARAFSGGMPAEALPWLRVAGSLGIVAGGLRWGLQRDVVQARPFLVMGVSGLGVLVASLVPARSGEILAASGVLILLAGTVASLNEAHTPIHRVWPLAAALVLAGMPWTPGGILAGALAPLGAGVGRILWSAFGVLGMALLAAGMARVSSIPLVPWPSGETLVKSVYGLGLALPVLVAVGVGASWPGATTISGGMTAAGVMVLMAAGWAAGRRVRAGEGERWSRFVAWLDPNPLYGLLWGTLRGVLGAIRGIGEATEGEGAVLWMMVVVVLVALALGRPSP